MYSFAYKMPAQLLYQSGTTAVQIFIQQTQLHPSPNIYIIYPQTIERLIQTKHLAENVIKDE